MQTKLTLRIEESLIEQAKGYAKENDKSLSLVVSDYFQALTANSKRVTPASPITRSLIGIIESSQVDETDYKAHLEQKYL